MADTHAAEGDGPRLRGRRCVRPLPPGRARHPSEWESTSPTPKKSTNADARTPRSFLGRPAEFAKWWDEASPLNQMIDDWGLQTGRSAASVNQATVRRPIRFPRPEACPMNTSRDEASANDSMQARSTTWTWRFIDGSGDLSPDRTLLEDLRAHFEVGVRRRSITDAPPSARPAFDDDSAAECPSSRGAPFCRVADGSDVPSAYTRPMAEAELALRDQRSGLSSGSRRRTYPTVQSAVTTRWVVLSEGSRLRWGRHPGHYLLRPLAHVTHARNARSWTADALRAALDEAGLRSATPRLRGTTRSGSARSGDSPHEADRCRLPR